jgi:hypothetical protein
VAQLVVVPLPQLEQAHEVGALVGEGAVRVVGGVGAIKRTLARVLDGERAGDDQHLAQAMLVAGGQDQPADRRVQREARHRLAERRDAALLVDRAEFLQLLIAVCHRPAGGCLKEGEVLHATQAQRGHAQDDGGQRGTRDLRVGEGRPTLEVLLVVEADADAGGDASATTGALVGRGLR